MVESSIDGFRVTVGWPALQFAKEVPALNIASPPVGAPYASGGNSASAFAN
jgi:hypothetical protein